LLIGRGKLLLFLKGEEENYNVVVFLKTKSRKTLTLSIQVALTTIL